MPRYADSEEEDEFVSSLSKLAREKRRGEVRVQETDQNNTPSLSPALLLTARLWIRRFRGCTET